MRHTLNCEINKKLNKILRDTYETIKSYDPVNYDKIMSEFLSVQLILIEKATRNFKEKGMYMHKTQRFGTVNLGYDTLQGHGEQSQPGKNDYEKNHPKSEYKQQYNPGRNQELNINPGDFSSTGSQEKQNSNVPSVHEKIKELIGKGKSRKRAVLEAMQHSKDNNIGAVGNIPKKNMNRKKVQAELPAKKVSVYGEKIQGYPFI